MAAAQRLATATSIDLAVARSAQSTRTKAQDPVQRTITIGDAGTKGLRTYVQLFAVIAAANDVRSTWHRIRLSCTRTASPRTSTPATRCTPAWSSRWCARRTATSPRAQHRPTPTITARLNFQLAFGARIGQRLARGARGDPVEVQPRPTRPSGNAIALRNKEIELHGLLPPARRKRAAPGRPAGRRRGTRRRRGERATGPAGGPGWATAPSCRARAPHCDR